MAQSLESLTIEKVVRSFYNKATNDIIIGYHFRNIKNFDEHIPRIVEFWELHLLNKKSDIDPPFDLYGTHAPLQMTVGQLNRWVVLFFEVLDESKLNGEMKDKWKTKIQVFQKKFLLRSDLFLRQP